ncbi:MAG: RNA polymerase sigma factor [Planctomycetes bacterium]|nr:RNA polymerase sigma factor [Planctomycetota bacterium]
MSSDEAGLVQRCLLGQADAIRQLVERFQPEVFGLCVRLLHHRHDAEDVTQEVFLRVFRSLRRWDAERPLKPWIIGIAVNRCRTWLAQRARRPESVDYLQDTAPSPPPDDSAELLREIRAAVDDLRPDYRTVFVLFHDQGQAYEEIAQELERPVGTIKTWLHRARLEVLERLQRRGMVPADANPALLEEASLLRRPGPAGR